jgi:hypothetical protein
MKANDRNESINAIVSTIKTTFAVIPDQTLSDQSARIKIIT